MENCGCKVLLGCNRLGLPLVSSVHMTNKRIQNCRFWIQSCKTSSNESRKLVLEVKKKLETNHYSLPVGKNGRDDEDLILWFLERRKFSVQETIPKLTRFINWRKEFCSSEESMRRTMKTRKAYVHDFFDVNGRPVLVVIASKHIPAEQVRDQFEDEKLCVYLIEEALRKLPAGKEDILGIVDLRGFGIKNADFKFLAFLFDALYYYFPDRMGQVLLVDAPLIFQPIWELAKPLFGQYTYLVRFCSIETVKKEYFTEGTLPVIFRE